MLSTLKHPWLMKKNNPGSGSTTKVPVGIIKCIVKDTCHEIDLVCVSFFFFGSLWLHWAGGLFIWRVFKGKPCGESEG